MQSHERELLTQASIESGATSIQFFSGLLQQTIMTSVRDENILRIELRAPCHRMKDPLTQGGNILARTCRNEEGSIGLVAYERVDMHRTRAEVDLVDHDDPPQSLGIRQNLRDSSI